MSCGLELPFAHSVAVTNQSDKEDQLKKMINLHKEAKDYGRQQLLEEDPGEPTSPDDQEPSREADQQQHVSSPTTTREAEPASPFKNGLKMYRQFLAEGKSEDEATRLVERLAAQE